MRMVGNSLLNFLKCLIYIFVPLGCIFLGFLCGVQVFLGALSEQAAYAAEQLRALADGAEIKLDRLLGFLISSVRELDWNDPFGAIGTILQGDWVAAKLSEFLQLTQEQAAQLQAEVLGVAEHITQNLVSAVAVLIVFVIFGVIAAYFVTNYFVRKSTVRRGFWGFWVVSLADALLTATLVAFVAWLLSVTKAGAAVTAAVGALVFGFIALAEAYLLHGRKKISFRAVVNFKNMVFVCLSQIAVFAAAAGLGALLAWLTGAIVGAALALSVAIVALLVVGVNAESYVDRLVKRFEKYKQEKQTEGEEGTPLPPPEQQKGGNV